MGKPIFALIMWFVMGAALCACAASGQGGSSREAQQASSSTASSASAQSSTAPARAGAAIAAPSTSGMLHVEGTQLVEEYERGAWRPYSEEELLDVLCRCMEATPPFMRVSRMIRDISAKDILVGNKKTNLRQLVDERLSDKGARIQEIRFREIATGEVDIDELRMLETSYETRATKEFFLQWVTPANQIAGFLRLSLPKDEAFDTYEGLPVERGQAMIREVHVYGVATRVGATGESVQHHGLGRRLVMRALEIAGEAGYSAVNVISAVGTRDYYRSLGFMDHGLYQTAGRPN